MPEKAGVERAQELNANGYMRSWPHAHSMDGFFAAAWQKV
jgi:16S rRNA (cytosine967-C5)-methyltransferase